MSQSVVVTSHQSLSPPTIGLATNSLSKIDKNRTDGEKANVKEYELVPRPECGENRWRCHVSFHRRCPFIPGPHSVHPHRTQRKTSPQVLATDKILLCLIFFGKQGKKVFKSYCLRILSLLCNLSALSNKMQQQS